MLLAVVDTNVWISALLNPDGAPAAIAEYFGRQDFTAVMTPKLLLELEDVGSRPRLVQAFGLSSARLERLLELIERQALFIPEPPIVAICRDPRDDMFIAAAASSGASHLVTRDDDLKDDPAVADFLEKSDVTVLSVRRFLEHLRS